MLGTTVWKGMAINLTSEAGMTNYEAAPEVSQGLPPPNLDGGTVIMALDLLSHWWSRPVGDEVAFWLGVAEAEEFVADKMAAGQWRPSSELDSVERLLEEYERLFVGPGQVPCPPYESYWRNDVPVEIRRSLMGPCTADLMRLYGEIGLEVAPRSGALPDEIAIELEALAFSLSLEGATAVSRTILFDHLGRWLPQLCRAVAHEAQTPFYKTLPSLTLGWLGPIKSHLQSMAAREVGAE